MCCFNWDRRAALRESKEGSRSEEARMMVERKRNLNAVIWAGIDVMGKRKYRAFWHRWEKLAQLGCPKLKSNW